MKATFLRHYKHFREGAEQGGSILVNQGAFQNSNGDLQSPFKLEKIEQNINSNLFKEYEASCANNIRKCFNNIPPVLIDYQEGKLGGLGRKYPTGNFYNSQTSQDRQVVLTSLKRYSLRGKMIR